MSFESSEIIELKDYIVLILGFALSICWTFILYKLKPNLQIVSAEKENNDLKIRIKNKGWFKAVNLKMEVCVVRTGYTYHFKVDKEDFLILPPKNKKTKIDKSYYRDFKIHSLSESAKRYTNYNKLINEITTLNNQDVVRVRIHANHSYSGFGRAIEQKFNWTNNKFDKI